ncbi:MAG: amidohydrolase [Firmicutes bacterium]|nr:amidohydrolase [Bacillota bacterium]
MSIQNLKETIKRNIDQRQTEILNLAQTIYENPETGYREWKTSNLVKAKFQTIVEEVMVFPDIPGVKVTVDTGKPGPNVAVLGELDALLCPNHPDSEASTGAMHACGHNMQIATMMGAFMGIIDSEAVEELSGKIHFIAVPAEECIELGFRKELREQGVIRYFSGKAELLHRGWFDDVDMCMLLHSTARPYKFAMPGTSNGCVVKTVRYIGKPAHAGGAPDRGINALYAANLGLMAINSIREGFKEKDYIRVHPIITKGGDSVNVIPSEVKIETFVRGRTIEAIQHANAKVNRALLGGAIALGAKVEIEDFGGYMPEVVDADFAKLARKIMGELVNAEEIDEDTSHGTGSTDMGDLSTLMPALQPSLGGVQGHMHGDDYTVVKPENTVLGAKFLALAVVELLSNEAANAKAIIENYKPVFKSKDEYFRTVDSMFSKRALPPENCGDFF